MAFSADLAAASSAGLLLLQKGTQVMPADSDPPQPKAAPGAVTVKDAAHAPVIYFDGAPNFGCNNGVVNVTLAVTRHLANANGNIDFDVVAAAFLRCSIPAAIDLRNALNDALLLGAPAGGGDKAN
jgi:hypothetical protein